VRTVKLLVKVKAPDTMGNDEVAGYINQMINIGYADACESAEDIDLPHDVRQVAKDGTSLEIKPPTVID
jgi:hypothetical protein